MAPIKLDPRDIVQPVPSLFVHKKGKLSLHTFNDLAEGVQKSRIYWIYGDPRFPSQRSDVDDPPCAGWSTVLVLSSHGATMELFCPFSFRSYTIGKDSYEATSMSGAAWDGMCAFGSFRDSGQMYFQDLLPRKWIEHSRCETPKVNWDVAKRVMNLLNIRIPSATQIAEVKINRRKPKADAEPATDDGFKLVKRSGRKGEILQAYLDGVTSIDALVKQFEITRSNLLSQLFLLRKDHGIGYTISGDNIVLDIPRADPFGSETF
jgi:hypothetical protein